ncbi:transposase, partial [Streptomyces mirabilis]
QQVSERDAFAELSRFRTAFYGCLSARADAFFELTDALLCADGPTRTPVELSLLAEHQRGYGPLYGALNHGRLDVDRLRDLLCVDATTAFRRAGRAHRGRLPVATRCPHSPTAHGPCPPGAGLLLSAQRDPGAIDLGPGRVGRHARLIAAVADHYTDALEKVIEAKR